MHAIVLQLFHEANAFLPERVTLADFRRRHYVAGEEVRQRFGASNNWMGGVLAALDEAHVQTTIGLCTAAHPGGMVDAASYAVIEDDLLASLDGALAAQPCDLVLLLLHGALVVEGVDDAEGRFCQRVRQRIGQHVTLACTLDFHANPGDALLANADLVLGGLRYPHDDTRSRGGELVQLALRHRAGEALRSRHFRLPLAVPMPAQNTMDEGPFAALADWCRRRTQADAGQGVLDIGLLGGFPYTDSDRGCTSVLVTGSDGAQACAAFAELAALVWRHHAALLAPFPGPAQLQPVLGNLAHHGGTLVLADVGDNPGAGGAGNDTRLLSLLLAQPYPFAAGILIDPQLALQAQAAGVGGTVLVAEHKAVVLRSGPLAYRNAGPMMTGELVDGGLGAVLQVGNGELLVSSGRIQAYDSAAFASQGVSLHDKRVILIKTSAHFRASYSALASAGIVLADSGGWASPDMRRFDHAARRRPILPLAPLDGAAWNASVQAETQRNQGLPA